MTDKTKAAEAPPVTVWNVSDGISDHECPALCTASRCCLHRHVCPNGSFRPDLRLRWGACDTPYIDCYSRTLAPLEGTE